MSDGKIRIKSINKLLKLQSLELDKRKPLVIKDIIQAIGCCKGHAYNYLRALKKLRSSIIA